jgi:hypothetical protein
VPGPAPVLFHQGHCGFRIERKCGKKSAQGSINTAGLVGAVVVGSVAVIVTSDDMLAPHYFAALQRY